VATLSTIRDHIKTDLFIIGSTDYDAQIDNAIRSALRLMWGKQFWFLQTSQSITLATSATSVALPTNFSAPNTFRLSASGVWLGDGRGFDFLGYNRFEREKLRDTTLLTQQPSACAILGSTLYVDCTSNADYTISCNFWKKDASLPTSSGDTSVWFDEGYDVIRSRAMVIFKREAQGFTVADTDSSLADYYYNALCQTAAQVEGGR